MRRSLALAVTGEVGRSSEREKIAAGSTCLKCSARAPGWTGGRMIYGALHNPVAFLAGTCRSSVACCVGWMKHQAQEGTGRVPCLTLNAWHRELHFHLDYQLPRHTHHLASASKSSGESGISSVYGSSRGQTGESYVAACVNLRALYARGKASQNNTEVQRHSPWCTLFGKAGN